MIVAITIGVLFAGSVFLMTSKKMLRVILGFVLLGHAANLILIAAGGTMRREASFGTHTDPELVADPLPQAFVLTAIVIAFAITVVMLVLAVTGRPEDDIIDDIPEDDDVAGKPGTAPEYGEAILAAEAEHHSRRDV